MVYQTLDLPTLEFLIREIADCGAETVARLKDLVELRNIAYRTDLVPDDLLYQYNLAYEEIINNVYDGDQSQRKAA